MSNYLVQRGNFEQVYIKFITETEETYFVTLDKKTKKIIGSKDKVNEMFYFQRNGNKLFSFVLVSPKGNLEAHYNYNSNAFSIGVNNDCLTEVLDVIVFEGHEIKSEPGKIKFHVNVSKYQPTDENTILTYNLCLDKNTNEILFQTKLDNSYAGSFEVTKVSNEIVNMSPNLQKSICGNPNDNKTAVISLSVTLGFITVLFILILTYIKIKQKK